MLQIPNLEQISVISYVTSKNRKQRIMIHFMSIDPRRKKLRFYSRIIISGYTFLFRLILLVYLTTQTHLPFSYPPHPELDIDFLINLSSSESLFTVVDN